MTTVQIDGQQATFTAGDVVGVGGEATVFRYRGQAVKVYTQPTRQRANKLLALQRLTTNLPNEVIAPQTLVHDAKGRMVVGFVMQLLPPDYVPLRQLASKKYRLATGLTTRDVVAIYIALHNAIDAIHRAGLVVGDLNDLNVMVRGHEIACVDVDSMQFDRYPCPVGTEAFIDPQLYGHDLAQQPVFTQETDWYAFAVLLFKSLTLAHPYGGTHPTLKTLTKRAQACASVFDAQVTYPRIANPLTLLGDLRQPLAAIFRDRWRGRFDDDLLRRYRDDLHDCSSCSGVYPRSIRQCPFCAAVVPVPTSALVGSHRTVLRVAGSLVAWRVRKDGADVFAHESGKLVCYRLKGQHVLRKASLFNAMPYAQYTILDDVLVVSPDAGSDALLLVDISGDVPRAIGRTTTDRFGNSRAVFAAGDGVLYRLSGGFLMRGRIQGDDLVEDMVTATVDGQTWFQADAASQRVLGYFRTMQTYTHFLVDGTSRRDVTLPPLHTNETLLETQTLFGGEMLLVQRLTRFDGRERLYLDEVTSDGTVVQSRVITDAVAYLPLGQQAYARNRLLMASDEGVVQVSLDTLATKIFAATEPVVKQGDSLFRYGDGLLVIAEDRVSYIEA